MIALTHNQNPFWLWSSWDRAANSIHELCSRCCQTIDAQDSEGWARCFLPVWRFELTAMSCAATGRYECAEAHTRVLRGRHMTLNHLYDVDGDPATGRGDGRLDRHPLGLQDHGQSAYDDELVKVGGEWKIRHRRVVNDHLVPDPARPISLADSDVAPHVQQLSDTTNNLAWGNSGEW